jgi:hypothetical protein
MLISPVTALPVIANGPLRTALPPPLAARRPRLAG